MIEAEAVLFAETAQKAQGLASGIIGSAIFLIGVVLLGFSKDRPSVTRGIFNFREPQGRVYFVVRYILGPLFLVVVGLGFMIEGFPRAF